MLDALEANLRRAVVYDDTAKMFLFLVNLNATKLEIVQGVKLLKEASPEDVDPKLTYELLHFHLYERQKSRGYRKAIYFLVSRKFLSNYVQGKNSHSLSQCESNIKNVFKLNGH